MDKLNIAIQGGVASFHEIAAERFFGEENVQTIECMTFRELCEQLKTGKADFAVMAIENSIAGSLLQNYTLLQEYNFKIVGEVFLHIQMNLMALPGVKKEDLKFIHSHPIAIRQCEEYLRTIKGAKLVDKEDTAESAKQLVDLQLRDTAAVANDKAAQTYGLDILERRIETHKKNFTRFLVLKRTAEEDDQANKASISFQTGHEPGCLYKVLGVFNDRKLNMTKIQSVPIVGKPYEYSFHIDLEWEEDQQFKVAIPEVLSHVSNLTILGIYKKGAYSFEG